MLTQVELWMLGRMAAEATAKDIKKVCEGLKRLVMEFDVLQNEVKRLRRRVAELEAKQ